MKTIELPVTSPQYSYQHSIAAGGIASNLNKSTENWYYNNIIQWKCSLKFLFGYTGFDLVVSNNKVHDIDTLDCLDIDIHLVENCSITFIKSLLEKDYYVLISGADDFHIKNKCWFHEKHFPHTGLITGYDDYKNTFTFVGYDSRWIFKTFTSPQRCIANALISSCLGGEVNRKITALKANSNIVKIDISSIRKNLIKYLDSDFDKYPIKDYSFAEGIVVYDYLLLYLKKLQNNDIPHNRMDRRVFRTLWEHKKCMLKRIEAIEKELNWNVDLSDKYNKVVDLSNKARIIYGMINQSFSESAFEKVERIITSIKKLEIEILNILIDRTKEI